MERFDLCFNGDADTIATISADSIRRAISRATRLGDLRGADEVEIYRHGDLQCKLVARVDLQRPADDRAALAQGWPGPWDAIR